MLYVNKLSDAVAMATVNRSRLLILKANQVEKVDSSVLNINQELSGLLVSISRKERARSIKGLLDDLILTISDDLICLTGLEILFDRSLAVEPLRLLNSCAGDKTLLISWPGEVTANELSYGIPSHPEYRTYKASNLRDVIFLTADAQLN